MKHFYSSQAYILTICVNVNIETGIYLIKTGEWKVAADTVKRNVLSTAAAKVIVSMPDSNRVIGSKRL